MKTLDCQKSIAYLLDEFVPFSEANLSIGSSPVLYGLSVYTVFSLNWNERQQKLYAFRLRDHYDRLVNSARIMDFHSFVDDWSWERFEDTMIELVKQNAIKEDALVRVTVFIDEIIAGTKIHNLKNALSAYVYPMGEILPATGANLCISSWVRNSDNSIPAKAKINGSYVNASLMKNEAILNGYDDAIALDHHGHVAESTVANLFIVKNGVLVTPDTSTDILEGITRDSILELARSEKIPMQERSIDRTELYKADEAFLCGTSARITPILSIDKRPIGTGKPGKITHKITRTYAGIQNGEVKDSHGWVRAIQK